jgi:hypothetical protein
MKSAGKDNSMKKNRPGEPSAQNRAQVNKVKALFQEWLQDSSGYDEETWPQLKRALSENHSKLHKLFDE